MVLPALSLQGPLKPAAASADGLNSSEAPLHTALPASSSGKARRSVQDLRGGRQGGTAAPTDTSSGWAWLLSLLYLLKQLSNSTKLSKLEWTIYWDIVRERKVTKDHRTFVFPICQPQFELLPKGGVFVKWLPAVIMNS